MNESQKRIMERSNHAVFQAFGSATKDELLSLIVYIVTGPLFGRKVELDRMREELRRIRVDALLAEMEDLTDRMPHVTGPAWMKLADRFTVVNNMLNELQPIHAEEPA